MNALSKPQFTLASVQDAEQFISDAKDWYNYRRGSERFEDTGAVIVRALAEYMANQEQKTIYKSKAELV